MPADDVIYRIIRIS